MSLEQDTRLEIVLGRDKLYDYVRDQKYQLAKQLPISMARLRHEDIFCHGHILNFFESLPLWDVLMHKGITLGLRNFGDYDTSTLRYGLLCDACSSSAQMVETIFNKVLKGIWINLSHFFLWV